MYHAIEFRLFLSLYKVILLEENFPFLFPVKTFSHFINLCCFDPVGFPMGLSKAIRNFNSINER